MTYVKAEEYCESIGGWLALEEVYIVPKNLKRRLREKAKLNNNRRWWISNDVMIKLNGACVEIAVINGRKLRFIDGVDCFQKRKPI